ncbi:hypothetical protein CLU79DRAFT_727108 [Phycomyces nitens]|nr:hypothetical protein CLU79DRAFT_727108 [Phycomyces nitens]
MLITGEDIYQPSPKGVKHLQDVLCIFILPRLKRIYASPTPHYNNLRVPSLSFNVISHLVFTFSIINYLHQLQSLNKTTSHSF